MRVKYDIKNRAIRINIPAEDSIFAPLITRSEEYIWWLSKDEARQLIEKLQEVIDENQT